jgi:hypothetical protein
MAAPSPEGGRLKNRRLFAVIASLALLFNASGVAMAWSALPGTHVLPADTSAPHCADMAGDHYDRTTQQPGGCCADCMCLCVVHAIATVAMPLPVMSTLAEGPGPVSPAGAAPAPFDDPLRPPIA